MNFSEQNLVDCVYGAKGGCQGGWMPTAFTYIKSSGGIDTMVSYPVNIKIFKKFIFFNPIFLLCVIKFEIKEPFKIRPFKS